MHYFPAHIQVLYMEGGKGASPSQDLRKLIASVAVVGKLKQGTRRQFKKLEGISIAIRIEEKYFFACSKLINSTQLTNNLTYAASVKCLMQSHMLIVPVFKSVNCILCLADGYLLQSLISSLRFLLPKVLDICNI